MTASSHDMIPSFLRPFIPYWILALSVFVLYSNVYDNSFLFDDALLIQMNENIRGWGHLGAILTSSTTDGAHIVGGFYRPVQMFLYLLVSNEAGGDDLFWFHFLNIALHVANTCFVYRLGTKLGFNAWGVFLAALIWGIHPLHTEAVTYMSATADPLFAFFCLWAILTLLPDFTLRNVVLAFPLYLLGLLSKETTVMFPLLMMACLFYLSPRKLDWRTYRLTLPFWIVSLGYAYWRSHATGFDGPQTYSHLYQMPAYAGLKLYADHPLSRLYTFCATLPAYLRLLVWPEGLHMERSFPIFTKGWNPPVLTGLAMIVFATGHIVRTYRIETAQSHPSRGGAMSFGLLWLAAAHAPDTGLLIPMNSLFLEHWMYLPSVGLFLGMAQTIATLAQGRAKSMGYTASIAALAFAAMLAARTYAQNEIWHDAVSFYNNIFAYGEKSARARNNLALYYSDRGQYAEAIAQFDEAIKTADIYAETRYNMALTYLNLSPPDTHIAEAMDNLHRSLEIDPRFFRSYQTLGDVYARLLHDPQNAALNYAKAKEIFNRQQ